MSKTKRKIPDSFKPFIKKKGENHLTKKKMEKSEKREVGSPKNDAREKYMIERAEMLLKSPVSMNKSNKGMV